LETFLLSTKLLRLIGLWLAIALVHFWLIFEANQTPQTAPFNDVNLYGLWVDQSSQAGGLLGIKAPWVYPFVAMAPMYLAKLIGGANGILTGWLILISLLNFFGLSAIVDWGREGKHAYRAASFYLLFLALLGPVAIGRIDAAATFAAMLGLVQVYRERLRLGMVLFTLGAWLKIWPVAAILALYTSAKHRLSVLLAAISASTAILAIGYFLGGNENLFSFVTMQGNRGLQVESVAATFWVWAAKAHLPGAGIYFDTALVTNQVSGSFTGEVSSLLGLVMVGALAITAWLSFNAYRAGAEFKHLFAAALLTGTLDLIVFNKVGSPQFELWLAVPLMAGILFDLPKWRIPLVGGALIALLTNLLYPVFYMDLMILGDLGVWLLTLRNAALIALLVWANLRLSSLAKKADEL
jgi:hypothetical protein